MRQHIIEISKSNSEFHFELKGFQKIFMIIIFYINFNIYYKFVFRYYYSIEINDNLDSTLLYK